MFQKVQNSGLPQVKETTKETGTKAEMTGIGIDTVEGIIKTWRIVETVSIWEETWLENKDLFNA